MSHTLYSYRRCPYAMRARMALVHAGIQCDVHEIDFKNKPVAMLSVSPKGTVPVLVCDDGDVMDESLDIMLWALEKDDPNAWLRYKEDGLSLIQINDGEFKENLDRYKYPNRFEGEDCSGARDRGEVFIAQLNERLESHEYLMGGAISLADIAIFPFIRQFSNVDKEWFYQLPYSAVQKWLDSNLSSSLFLKVIQKSEDGLYQLI